jgi:hypothetical protein
MEIRREAEAEDLWNQLIDLETRKRLAELDGQTEHAKALIRRQLADDNLEMRQWKRVG